MRNPKKGPFDLSVDLEKIPSFKTRFASMDNLTGGAINIDHQATNLSEAVDAAPSLREKLKSGQDIRSTPSVILRRKGIRV